MALPALALLGTGAEAFWDICPNFGKCFLIVGNWLRRIITGTLVAVNIIGFGLLVWNACLVNREEREIAKAAEGLLSTPERHDLEGRVAELERRVTNMDEEISSLARRMAVLEKPKDSKFQGCAS